MEGSPKELEFDAARMLEAARAIELEATKRVAALRAKAGQRKAALEAAEQQQQQQLAEDNADLLDATDVEVDDDEPQSKLAPPPVPQTRAKTAPPARATTASDAPRARLPGLPPPREAVIKPPAPAPVLKTRMQTSDDFTRG